MSLHKTQNLFKKSILAAQADPRALRNLKPAGQLSLDKVFEIYHRAYFARLSSVLGKTFPAVKWVVGDILFTKICHKYIESQPSISYNLLSYGKFFPEFLGVISAARGIPFLADLAKFEWAYKEIYHAPAPDPLTVERVSELSRSEDFRIQFIDAMEIWSSPYSIYEIWCRKEEPSYRFEDIDWNRAESLVIFKKNHHIEILQIDIVEAEILRELKEGSSISSALADFSGVLTPDRIARLFQMMMKAGLVDDIVVLES